MLGGPGVQNSGGVGGPFLAYKAVIFGVNYAAPQPLGLIFVLSRFPKVILAHSKLLKL